MTQPFEIFAAVFLRAKGKGRRNQSFGNAQPLRVGQPRREIVNADLSASSVDGGTAT